MTFNRPESRIRSEFEVNNNQKSSKCISIKSLLSAPSDGHNLNFFNISSPTSMPKSTTRISAIVRFFRYFSVLSESTKNVKTSDMLDV